MKRNSAAAARVAASMIVGRGRRITAARDAVRPNAVPVARRDGPSAILGAIRGAILGTILAVILGSGLAAAAPVDPASAEILGLRLGMTEPAVTAALRGQRIRAGTAPRREEDCGPAIPAGAACHVTLAAATPDGALSVDLAGSPLRVGRITYRLAGRAPGEPAIIVDAVLERFGRPDEPAPMTWCRHAGADHRCAAGEPVLRFYQESLTLVLDQGTGTGEGR